MTETPPAPSLAEERSARIAVTLFPLLILAGGVLAVLTPDTFTGLGPLINPLLGVIMFGMGLTLTPPDLALVMRRPFPVVAGVMAQFAVMPLLGWLVSVLLGLPPALALWLAGRYLPVDAGSMAGSILQIVLVPVLLGLAVRFFLPSLVQRCLPALPWVSVAAITVVVVAVVSGSAEIIFSAGLLVLAAVILHNGLGYALGYGAARLLNCRSPHAAPWPSRWECRIPGSPPAWHGSI